jgi:hypothetical protein
VILGDELEAEPGPAAPPASSSGFPDVPPLAHAIFPAAIVGLVDRQKHPIVWWLFGVIPLAGAGAQMVIKRRVW